MRVRRFRRPVTTPSCLDRRFGGKAMPGYIKSLALDDPSGTAPGWVMVCADSFIAANQAADLVKVQWHSGNVGERL